MEKKINLLVKRIKAFSLIELIIVVAIISVLSVSGFLILTKWLGKARDSSRLSDITLIDKAISIFILKNDVLPNPDGLVQVQYKGIDVWEQGIFGQKTINQVGSLSKIPVDPTTKSYYSYSRSTDKKKYQLSTIFENEEYYGYLNKAYAETFLARVKGTYDQALMTLYEETSKIYYIIAVPSIVLAELKSNPHPLYGDLKDSFVVDLEGNIPEGYSGTIEDRIKYWFEADVLWSGTNLNDIDSDLLRDNIIQTYKLSPISDNYNFKGIVDGDEVVLTDQIDKSIKQYGIGDLTVQISYSDCTGGKINGKEYTSIEYTYEAMKHGSSVIGVGVEKTIDNKGEKQYEGKISCYDEQTSISNETYKIECESGYVENNDGCVQNVCNNNLPANGKPQYTIQKYGVDWIYSESPGECTYICQDGYEGVNCDAKKKTITSVVYDVNGRNYEFDEFELEYGNPQTKTSKVLNIANGTSRLTAQIVLQQDGQTVVLMNESEEIICNQGYTSGGGECNANDYTLTFNTQGGSAVGNKAVKYDSKIGEIGATTRAGYTFQGWKIGEEVINSETVWNYLSNKEAVAQWTQDGVCGTANGVATVTAPTTNLCTVGRASGITPNTGTYTWSCSVSGATTASCSAPRQYVVTFNGNGGSGHSPGTKNVTYNGAVGTLASNPSRSGYTFKGWYTATSGGTLINTSTVVTSNVTWYAQWIQNGVCGTANGVATVTAPTTNLCTVGTASGTTTNTGTYTWSCSVSGATTASCSAPRQYVVTFNGNGGSGHSPGTKNVTYNGAVGTLPSNPTRSGYTFGGWYTATSGGTLISTSTVVTANVTWYAQWIWACGNTVSAGGYTYTTKVGPDGKCWTSSNMKHAASSGSQRCYNGSQSNCDTYGRLYDWNASRHSSVCGALGAGWALPTDAQWTTLQNSGGNGRTGNRVGGLVQYLAGVRVYNGNYGQFGNHSYYRTATSGGSGARYRRFNRYDSSILRTSDRTDYGGQVICIKN